MTKKAKKAKRPVPTISRRRARLDDLRPYGRNPRTHSPEQIDQIAALMREYGQTQDLVVDDKLMILAGHGRAKAAAKLGWAEVWVTVLGNLSVAQKRGLVIADNKVPANAGWDEDLLRLELGELKRLDFDLAITGFDADALVSYLASKAPPVAPSTFQQFGEDIETDHQCPKCGYKWSGSSAADE